MLNQLLDHLVGKCQHLVWNCQSECLGGLEVEHELEFGGLHDRKIGWLLALEDAIDAPGRTPVLVVGIRPIGDQTAVGDDVAGRVDRR